jgi:hypothetical protein
MLSHGPKSYTMRVGGLADTWLSVVFFDESGVDTVPMSSMKTDWKDLEDVIHRLV